MASDEQRSPWFPVQPEGQPSDDAAGGPDGVHEPARPATPTSEPPATTPSFDDVIAPASGETADAATVDPPFELTPTRPSMSRPATTPIPRVTPEGDVPQAEAPQPQAFSPYLNAERPGAPRATYQAPVAEVFEPSAPAPVNPEPEFAPSPMTPDPTPVAQAFEVPVESSPPSTAYSPTPYSPPTASPAWETPAWETPASETPASATPTASPAADQAWGPDRRAGSMFATPEPSAPGVGETVATDRWGNGAVGHGAAGTDAVGTDAVGPDAVAEEPWTSEPWTSEPEAQEHPPAAQNPIPDSRQPILYAPWTGAIPQVQAAPSIETAPPVQPVQPVQAPEPEPALAASPFAPFERAPQPDPEPEAQAEAGHTAVSEAPSIAQPEEPFLVRGLVPTPIEADDGEIVAPVLPPDAREIQPHGADPMRESPNAAAPDFTPSQQSAHEYVPDAPDPVRQLAASALSNASFEAAGAPTPRGGVPLIGTDGDPMPSFGAEEPFVPRFEPFGGVVPAAVPSVSFTTPKPMTPPLATPPTSPLTDLAVPESDEPAYTPKQDFFDPEPWSAHDAHADAPTAEHAFPDGASPDGAATEPPAPDSASPPARPWSSVDPAEVEYADGAPLSVEAGAFGSVPFGAPNASDAPDDNEMRESSAASAPSWERIMGGEAAAPQTQETPSDVASFASGQFPTVINQASAPMSTGSWDDEVAARENSLFPEASHLPADADASPVGTVADAAHDSPTTPAASFFAATAARNARRVDDIEGTSPFTPATNANSTESLVPVESDPFPTRPLGSELAHSTPTDTLRSEPIHTTATAYTPPTGEWVRPAIAGSDAPTQVDGMAHVDDTAQFDSFGHASGPRGGAEADHAPHADASDAEPPADTTMSKTHRRRRLVLWIVLGAILAAAVGTFVYRMYFLPEPVILAVPTIIAEAPEPTAKPVAVTEASDFVKAMPSTVGTDVLVGYEVTDTVGDTTLPARAAEKVTLEYGPGSSSKVFTVEAFQHYNEDDAKTAYDSYATGATDVEDVEVDGAEVGERAYSAKGSTGTVVWRNGTVVFDVQGPADKVLHFYEHFGI